MEYIPDRIKQSIDDLQAIIEDNRYDPIFQTSITRSRITSTILQLSIVLGYYNTNTK